MGRAPWQAVCSHTHFQPCRAGRLTWDVPPMSGLPWQGAGSVDLSQRVALTISYPSSLSPRDHCGPITLDLPVGQGQPGHTAQLEATTQLLLHLREFSERRHLGLNVVLPTSQSRVRWTTKSGASSWLSLSRQLICCPKQGFAPPCSAEQPSLIASSIPTHPTGKLL